ncbi:hypothetical protein N0V93_006890 [Gnomoniopsis smithogilvyi]|uniref:Uncharacterized protein n=1 Tax=Gnomoniopsis smithogilvyi TaxID=1191159 RepID=A0A9W9CW52_9PEZI|nr:hypothetical protein N0V93_006890 [Gnomoniopsis smithogilvyi]
MKPVNSLQDFKPLPKAKVIEVQSYMKDVAPPPPPSPRVKDRYAARMAERARRKRERMQRIEEWPGWVPDEKVLGQQRQQHEQQQQQRRKVRIDVAVDSVEVDSLASRERWLSPRTWRRRVWGVVTMLGVLVLVAVIIVATTITQDNAPGVKTPLSVRLDLGLAETLEADSGFVAPASLPESLSLRTSPLVSPTARRLARRFRRRHR